MLFFCLMSALICAGVCAITLVMYRRALNRAGEDREKGLYLRFAGDLEARTKRGEITPELAREEQAEAARALLRSHEPVPCSDPVDPRILAGLGVFIAVAAMGVYLVSGQPGAPDQPFTRRLKDWEQHTQDGGSGLGFPEAAMVLRQYQRKRADDPLYWAYMGDADLRAQNYFAATRDYETLTRLAPNSASAWTQLGMASLFESGGKPTPRARQAFEQALRLEPRQVGARYFLGRIGLLEGDFVTAHRLLDGLKADLAPTDARQESVDEQLMSLKLAETTDREARVQIRAMVAGLAQSLKAHPDNPEGWARLLRSYRVLGDAVAVARTEADIRKLYQKTPAQAAAILEKARAPVGNQSQMGGDE